MEICWNCNAGFVVMGKIGLLALLHLATMIMILVGQRGSGCVLQILVLPLRVNVNLKGLTVEDLTNRRKVRAHSIKICVPLLLMGNMRV